jgi:hypothetical protein
VKRGYREAGQRPGRLAGPATDVEWGAVEPPPRGCSDELEAAREDTVDDDTIDGEKHVGCWCQRRQCNFEDGIFLERKLGKLRKEERCREETKKNAETARI